MLGAFADFFDGDWVFAEIFLEANQDYGNIGAAFVGFFDPLEPVSKEQKRAYGEVVLCV